MKTWIDTLGDGEIHVDIPRQSDGFPVMITLSAPHKTNMRTAKVDGILEMRVISPDYENVNEIVVRKGEDILDAVSKAIQLVKKQAKELKLA